MPSIAHDPGHGLWILSGPGSSYVLHLDDAHRLRGLHWGPRLTLDQAASLLNYPAPGRRSFEDPADGTLDLDTAGAMRYAHAGIQVRFQDGVRDLEPRLVDATQSDSALVLRFADRHYPLIIETHYHLREGTDVLERHVRLQHTGGPADGPITVVRADSATWVLPRLGDYRLSQVRGQWSAETRLTRTPLPYGETVTTSRRGITGHQANPWAMIDDGSATEEHGPVWSCALAWSGGWKLTAQRLPTERVTVSAGFGHDPVTRELAPGEELVTPVCVGAYTEDGFGAASRLWHRYVRDHVLAHPDEVRPVLYNSWEATGYDIDVTGQIELAEKAAALGVELFVMDDGWFGARTNDAAGLGDWTPNPERFPDGLAPLIDRVHELGMGFGLWVEPEMVNPDSDLYRAHPDWVLHQPHRRRTEHRNQLVLNLARPDVAAWVHGRLDELVTKNAIDFLKWDMNRPFTEAGWPDAEGDPDRLWTDHVHALYAILDRLRADHPDLRIESCSSGSGRLDLGILARSDQVWASDNTDAVDRVEIQHGFSQLYPAQVMGAWVTDSPNPFTGRSVPLDFRFRVAATGVLGLGGDLNRWGDTELARAAELVAEYKAARHLVQLGEQHRLSGQGDLTAVQYLAPDGRETAVIALRHARHFGHRDAPLPLRALDPAARYRDTATGAVHHGAVLLTHGLPLDLAADDHTSTLVHLVREPA
ncbi:alpha-galactosidase [Streptomyces sp. NPDC004237]|uniref:alpha-galactosidase n=1 Tax=Streptomyces sp. NPDC004237 TaxID=3154455 RepID=UPI0033AC4299